MPTGLILQLHPDCRFASVVIAMLGRPDPALLRPPKGREIGWEQAGTLLKDDATYKHTGCRSKLISNGKCNGKEGAKCILPSNYRTTCTYAFLSVGHMRTKRACMQMR